MKNKIVGYILVGVAALMGFMIWLFNNALTEIVNDSCSHGPACPMWGSISFHTNLSIGIMVFVALVGLALIFFGKDDAQIIKEFHREVKVVKEQVKPKQFDKEHYKKVLNNLDDDEKFVFQKILDNEGTVFQSVLVDSKHTKVRVTRILDRLEGKGLIERKRRGMTNIVILKD